MFYSQFSFVFPLIKLSLKPPLCKGRCPEGVEGLAQTPPQSALWLTAPLAQGSLYRMIFHWEHKGELGLVLKPHL